MSCSTRFAVSVHTLSLLAFRPNQLLRSEDIAKSVGTNPAVIRKILGSLLEAGMVRTQLGQGGGTALARDPAQISLLDVYRAVEEVGFFPLPRSTPSATCYVGHNIFPVLDQAFQAANDAAEAELAKLTIADMTVHVETQAGYAFTGDMKFAAHLSN